MQSKRVSCQTSLVSHQKTYSSDYLVLFLSNPKVTLTFILLFSYRKSVCLRILLADTTKLECSSSIHIYCNVNYITATCLWVAALGSTTTAGCCFLAWGSHFLHVPNRRTNYSHTFFVYSGIIHSPSQHLLCWKLRLHNNRIPIPSLYTLHPLQQTLIIALLSESLSTLCTLHVCHCVDHNGDSPNTWRGREYDTCRLMLQRVW